jgi:hypothetical protein
MISGLLSPLSWLYPIDLESSIIPYKTKEPQSIVITVAMTLFFLLIFLTDILLLLTA